MKKLLKKIIRHYLHFKNLKEFYTDEKCTVKPDINSPDLDISVDVTYDLLIDCFKEFYPLFIMLIVILIGLWWIVV